MSKLVGGGHAFQETILKSLQAVDSGHRFIPVAEEGLRDIPEGAVVFPSKNTLVQRAERKLLRLGKRYRYPTPIDKYLKRLPESTEMDRFARKQGIDVLYFPTPNWIPSGVPFILTVWDLAHRIYPFFPEFRSPASNWDSRERFYSASLPRAAYVITGTEAGKEQVHRFYRVDPPRIRVISFPTPQLEHGDQLPSCVDSNWPFRNNYLLYPAQFWPHKNHAHLLEGLSILAQKGLRFGLVLTGSDQGNRLYVQALVRRLSLEKQVLFAGFVAESELTALYRKALALVFPSYLGPDNLPPLEAMACQCPVIAADVEGARQQLGDAAVYFDPSDSDTLADAIVRVTGTASVREALIRGGTRLSLSRSPENYARGIVALLDEYSSISYAWHS
jgi:glycosyltransferase involved in cell wall biosynthesis